MILATNASPRPVPLRFVVTKGSNRCGLSASVTPGPVSSTSIISGRLTRAPVPGTARRTPGRKAVRSTMRPGSRPSSMASAAFLTRLRKAWISLSRLPAQRRQRGVVVDLILMPSAKPDLGQPLHVVEHRVDVDRLGAERALVAEHLHAVDQVADAIGLGADELGQRAVLVLEAGLQQLGGAADARQRVLDLVGQHGAMPDTERAAARWVSWRSIICAIERCCSISTIRPGWSGMRAGEHVDQRGARRCAAGRRRRRIR